MNDPFWEYAAPPEDRIGGGDVLGGMESFEAMVDEAEACLAPVIRTTPVEESEVLSTTLGVPVWLKLECLQVTGSFKIRGAYFALKRLRDAGAETAATCSAGNHGLGLAHAARLLGMPVQIYVPARVDAVKAALLEGLGATLIRSPFAGFDETELWAMERIDRNGIPFVSAYDDRLIMAGNGGTLMREIRMQCPELTTVVVPVGGGGMSGGMVACAARPETLIGAQSAASPALRLSLERGEAVTRLEAAETLAGGLEGGIGATGFAALKQRVSQVVEVGEPDLRAAMTWMLARHQYLIEPSSAVAIAACLSGELVPTGPTVVVISGRNVALETLQNVLA